MYIGNWNSSTHLQKNMNIDESTPPYDYTSMKYWDERYAADETVYEW